MSDWTVKVTRARAGSAPRKDPPKPEEKPDLEPLLAFWQRVLRLQDWDVTIKYVRYHQMPGSLGECGYSRTRKDAAVHILDPIDRPESEIGTVEQTVIHELLHLHFAPLETGSDTPDGVAEEQAVQSIATGLLMLKRAVEAAS